jgi:hypothetical protein
LAANEEGEDQRRLKPIFEEVLVIQETALCGSQIMIDTRFAVANRPTGG